MPTHFNHAPAAYWSSQSHSTSNSTDDSYKNVTLNTWFVIIVLGTIAALLLAKGISYLPDNRPKK